MTNEQIKKINEALEATKGQGISVGRELYHVQAAVNAAKIQIKTENLTGIAAPASPAASNLEVARPVVGKDQNPSYRSPAVKPARPHHRG